MLGYIILSLIFLLVIGIVVYVRTKYSILIRFENGKFSTKIDKKAFYTNNKIFITNGDKKKLVKKIKGLEINFYGSNNTLICPKSVKFSDSEVHFSGNNITFKLGEDCSIVRMKAVFGGGENGNLISIGKGFVNSGILQIFAGGGANNNLIIGDGSMASRDVTIYTNDGHDIIDKTTAEVINRSKCDLIIGNHVWIGNGATILKNTQIPDNTIIGAKSVVSGKLEEEFTVLLGAPAKVAKRQIDWRW